MLLIDLGIPNDVRQYEYIAHVHSVLYREYYSIDWTFTQGGKTEIRFPLEMCLSDRDRVTQLVREAESYAYALTRREP